MGIIKNIISFFNKLFIKKENIKMIDEPNIKEKEKNDNSFLNSLKTNVATKKKKNVETLICEGDGLGIQKKISY